MIRTATVTDVTETGVWVVSSWLTAPTGPLAASGSPKSGDAVLVVRTDDGEMVAVSSRPAALPTSSVDNTVARFDGTGGALQTSGVTIDDGNNIVTKGTFVSGNGATGSNHITVDAPKDTANADLGFRANGVNRWTIRRNANTESGSDAGSNLEILRRDDAGTLQGAALVIFRQTGRIRIGTPGATAGLEFGNSGPRDMAGSGSPEGVVTAPIGSTWRRTNGGAGTSFYVKESGSGNTGWRAV